MAESAMESDTPQYNMTCLACHVAFRTSELQRLHFKTDWHRYNLKRKIANLPPVSLEIFSDRLKAQHTRTSTLLEQVPEPLKAADTVMECSICDKSYATQNAWKNHCLSTKHKENLKLSQKTDDDVKRVVVRASPVSQQPRQQNGRTFDTEDQMIDDKIARSRKLAIEECIFCSLLSSSFDENVEHMTTIHGLFIPDIDYLSDMYGLIEYLGEKVSVGNVCLACNGKGRGFNTLEAVQKHMLDKGHCRIAYGTEDTDEEFAEFYDFSIMNELDEDEEDEEEDYDEDERMDDESDANSISETNAHIGTAYTDDFELVLPSGARIGHRALRRYYKQRLSRQSPKDLSSVHKLIGQYESLGWTGDAPLERYEGDRVTQLAARQALAATKRSIAKELRKKQLTFLKVGHHHNYQSHFRYQIL